MRTITHLVVHCTATPKNTTIASIRRYWKEALGFIGNPCSLPSSLHHSVRFSVKSTA